MSVQVALNDVEVSIANIQKLAKEFEVGGECHGNMCRCEGVVPHCR